MATAIEEGPGANLHVDRGNEPDYHFGTAEGWDSFEVVRWHSVEELSRPFSYELTLLRRAGRGSVEPERLVGDTASIAIVHERGRRIVHGIVGSAEEIDRTSAFTLFRVELMPPVVLARHRGNCRTYRKAGICGVVERLLENRPPGFESPGPGGLVKAVAGARRPGDIDMSSYVSPIAAYRWALLDADSARLWDTQYRSDVIQFNESDFDLLTRLLEEEGLTYYFEHGTGGSIMTITDRPASAPAYGEAMRHELRAGAHALDVRRERLRTFKHRHDLRPTATRVMDHDRFTPLRRVEGQATGLLQGPTGEHSLFAAPGGSRFVDLFSRVNMERHEAQQSLSSGSGNVRTLEPGMRTLVHDGDGLREERDLVIVRVEAFGQSLAPEGTVLDHEGFGFRDELGREPFYESRFQALRAERNFRPLVTREKPRMAGIHRAVVTAEEGGISNPEINANGNGDIRIRFSWDTRPPEAGVASSKWVPVVNYSSGTGWGSHHTPRVGQTVYVAFHDGDPDQPVVLGGFYSSQTPAPYDASQKPTVSAYRSQSSPGGGGYNELRFDDAKGAEHFSTRAELDAAHVINRHATRSVGGNDSADVGLDHSQTVGGDSTRAVGGDDSHSIGGDQTTAIGGDCATGIDGEETRDVGGDQVTTVGGACGLGVTASYDVGVGGNATFQVRGDFDIDCAGDVTIKGKNIRISAETLVWVWAKHVQLDGGGGAQLNLKEGDADLTGPHHAKMTGGGKAIVEGGDGGGSNITLMTADIKASAPVINLNPD